MNLIFTCSSHKDFDRFKLIINKSKYYADSINYEFKSLRFHCQDQNDADSLEPKIQELADKNDISGYFELEEK